MKLFCVDLWVDDGWQRFTIVHKVLAVTEKRAVELAIDFWKKKDSANIVRARDVYELKDFVEGVIC